MIRDYDAFDRNEIMNLYTSVGWTNYTDHPQMLEKAYMNSLCTLGAYTADNSLIGIIRAVGDGASILFIQDIIVFPTMKPLDGQRSNNENEKQSAEGTKHEPASTLKAEEKIDFSNVVIEPLFEDSVDFETFSKSDFRAVKVLACEAVPKSKKLLQFSKEELPTLESRAEKIIEWLINEAYL